MAKVSTDERFKRVMKFLMASNEPKIAPLLAQRGFSEEDRQEGWTLLDNATGRHMAMTPAKGTFSPNYKIVVESLDDWENTWFDVASAALSRKFPAVYERVFHSLSKVSGPEVVINVRTFLGRLDELSGDVQGQAALELLDKRGLTAQRIADAQTLLEELAKEQTDETEPIDTKALAAQREVAVDEMWAWFKDWSVTARTVIKNRNYHVMLGLVSSHGSKTDHMLATEEASAEYR